MLPIHFAPLQGYTDDVYRRAHHRICGGVAHYYTPFVRLEHGELRRKDVQDMLPDHNVGVPLTLQVIATDVQELERVLASLPFPSPDGPEGAAPLPLVDLNMGCPFPLQVRHGRGAGLLQHPDRVEAICRFVSEHREWRFSVKMRLGADDSDEWRSILPLLNATPLRHVTLHPRVAQQQYGGAPDREAFEAFLALSRHPVVYNGDILTPADIVRLEERYPQLGGVMIGRGLLARPTLAREYTAGAGAQPDAVVDALLQLHDAVRESYARRIPGEAQLLAKLRTFWDYAEPTLGRKAWKKVHKAGSMRNYLQAVAALR